MGSSRRNCLPHHSDVICRRPLFCGSAQAHSRQSFRIAARPHRQAQRCFSRCSLRPLRNPTAQERRSHTSHNCQEFALLIDRPHCDLGALELPEQPSGHVWALPDPEAEQPLFQRGLATLGVYGYLVKAGYFVWNREKHRYRIARRPRTTEVPLFWAHNIRANEACAPRDGNAGQNGFFAIDGGSSAIIKSDAVILQRTSNRRQKRRLIAAAIEQVAIIGGRGFVTENHTIVIVPDPTK